MSASGRVRIGELARRTGVSADVLRVWERRYGLLAPERTAGGQRLYSRDDEDRIRQMLGNLEEGLSAGEAARLIASPPPRGDRPPTEELARPLAQALDNLDAVGAHAALDRLFAELGLEATITGVVMPYLRDVGERWARAEITVGHEHFVSRLLHGRLLGAARGWDGGAGPRALLACAPGEEHDLALVSFGLALRSHGWRITYLGASTPVRSVRELVAGADYRAVVIAASMPERFANVAAELSELAAEVPVKLAGPGATERIADGVGARILEGDPVSAAADLAKSR